MRGISEYGFLDADILPFHVDFEFPEVVAHGIDLIAHRKAGVVLDDLDFVFPVCGDEDPLVSGLP